MATPPPASPSAPAAKPAAAAPAPQAPALPPAPEGFINVFVDGHLLHVKKGSTVKQAAEQAGKEIPHFCYHDRLSVAGNCRMCLVEVEGAPKPVASCHWPTAEGMKIHTEGKVTQEARKATMELLLANHPLDCPVCDQGGECKLQDQSVAYGSDRGHFHEAKRAVDDKFIGHKIKTVMTRCIHCTRCIRFATEVAGVEEFGATGRGENTQVGTYVEQALQSELAGNMIDLCPVGALTSAPFAFRARAWELERTASVDILDAVGTPIWVDSRAEKVMRVLPRECEEINQEWMTDAARFSTDALGENRLTTPYVFGNKTGWTEAFRALKKILAQNKPTQTAGILGALHAAEDAYAFREFLSQTLQTTHVDSRPARAPELPSTLGTSLESLGRADAVLLIGCNPRFEAPLLNLRLRHAVLKNKAAVASIGVAANLTYPYQHLGNAPENLVQLVRGKHAFAETLKNARAPHILFGAQAYAHPDAEALLALAQTMAPHAVIGALADTCGRITAHALGVLPGEKGKATAAILKAWHSGTVDTLIVHGEDTVTPLEVKRSKPGGTLIYLGTHHTPLAKMAEVALPVAAWSEKPGLYMNTEGRVQAAEAAVKPLLNAKEDWKVYRALSEELGRKLPFDTLDQLREKIAAANPAFAAANLGKVQPPALRAQGMGNAKSLSELPLEMKEKNHYLRLDYLRQSPTMQKIQAETLV